MPSSLRARLTFATVMATGAVFVALAGSSYATIQVTSKNVPKDALTGADIRNLTGRDERNNSHTGADVKNLTSGDVANGRLLAEDFAPGQLPAGAKGENGENGDKGEQGVQGQPGTAKAFARVSATGVLDPTRSTGVNSVLVTDRPPLMSDAGEDNEYCFDLTFVPKVAVGSPFSNNNGSVATAVSGESSSTALGRADDDGDEVTILPAVAGG